MVNPSWQVLWRLSFHGSFRLPSLHPHYFPASVGGALAFRLSFVNLRILREPNPHLIRTTRKVPDVLSVQEEKS